EGVQGAEYGRRCSRGTPKGAGRPAEPQDGGPELGSRYRPPNRGDPQMRRPAASYAVAFPSESGRQLLACWTFPSPVPASFRASSTANPRMYAVTERPAARASRDNRSTSRAMPSAFVAGSCRQNSTSLAMTLLTQQTLDLLKFT